MLVDRISGNLLRWYDVHARALPWRVPPGSSETPDPYRVWLSEIMLQQTSVAAVRPYFHAFTERWPRVADLAAADDADVMAAWAGLGYYSRARNLLAAARRLSAHGFPPTAAGLSALPGVGAYTSAAIAAIAFGERCIAVDANVERVGARLFAIDRPLPAARADIAAAFAPHVPAGRPGDFVQALMDLGSSICTPRSPRCDACPLASECAATTPEAYPVRPAKKARPVRHGFAWWLRHGDCVAFVRRPDSGLLPGMPGLPGSEWGALSQPSFPFAAEWRLLDPEVRHVFTHFELRLRIYAADLPAPIPSIGGAPLLWRPIASARDGIPTIFRKAVDVGLSFQPGFLFDEVTC